jgi:hypothetical protein
MLRKYQVGQLSEIYIVQCYLGAFECDFDFLVLSGGHAVIDLEDESLEDAGKDFSVERLTFYLEGRLVCRSLLDSKRFQISEEDR